MSLPRSVVLLLLLGLALLACPAEDDDEGSGGGGGGNDAAADTGGSDGPVSSDEVTGSYAVVSITLGTSVLTATNTDLGDGIQRRVDGTLDIFDAGTYARLFNFYQDDVLSETENASGTWELESDTILIITEADEAPSRVQYSLSGNTLTLTRIEDTASFEVDEMVVQRLTR